MFVLNAGFGYAHSPADAAGAFFMRSRTIHMREICCLLKLLQYSDIVANGEQRGVVFMANLADKRYRFVSAVIIQISSRFVGKHQARTVGDSSGNRNTLLLPDG